MDWYGVYCVGRKLVPMVLEEGSYAKVESVRIEISIRNPRLVSGHSKAACETRAYELPISIYIGYGHHRYGPIRSFPPIRD